MRQNYCVSGVASSVADSVEDRLAGIHGIFITNALHGLRGLVATFGRWGSLQFSEPRR